MLDVSLTINVAILRLIPENQDDQDMLKKLYRAELLTGSCWSGEEMSHADIQLLHKFD
jgi:hypothetical protein